MELKNKRNWSQGARENKIMNTNYFYSGSAPLTRPRTNTDHLILKWHTFFCINIYF